MRRLAGRVKRNSYGTEYKLRQAKNMLYRKQLLSRPTKAELVFKEYLEANKIRFIFQKGFLTPFHRILDFYLPGRRIGIEIDGGYHIAQHDKDLYKDRQFLKSRNIKVYRFWNEEVFDGSFKKKFASML